MWFGGHSIRPGRITFQLEDRAGNLWFGSDGLGAIRYDGSSFTRYTENRRGDARACPSRAVEVDLRAP